MTKRRESGIQKTKMYLLRELFQNTLCWPHRGCSMFGFFLAKSWIPILFLSLSFNLCPAQEGSFAFRFDGVGHYRETRFQRYLESLKQRHQGELVVLIIEELTPKSRDFIRIEWKTENHDEEVTKIPLVEAVPVAELIQKSAASSSLGIFFTRIPLYAGFSNIVVTGTSSESKFRVEVLSGRMSAMVHAWDRHGSRANDPMIIALLQDQIRLKLYPFQPFLDRVVGKAIPPSESKILVRVQYPESDESKRLGTRFPRAWLKGEKGEFEAVKIQRKNMVPEHRKCSSVEIFFQVPTELNSSCFDLILEVDDPRTGRDLTHGKRLVCWGRQKPRKAMIEYLSMSKTFGPHFDLLPAESLDSECAAEPASH